MLDFPAAVEATTITSFFPRPSEAKRPAEVDLHALGLKFDSFFQQILIQPLYQSTAIFHTATHFYCITGRPCRLRRLHLLAPRRPRPHLPSLLLSRLRFLHLHPQPPPLLRHRGENGSATPKSMRRPKAIGSLCKRKLSLDGPMHTFVVEDRLKLTTFLPTQAMASVLCNYWR